MKKIVSMIAGILVLISAAVTAGAEKISIANEKYPAPGYAGAVFGGTVEDSGDSNNFSLFSAKESSACDYIYEKLWDLEWSRNNIAKRHYEIKDSNGDVVESGDDYFVGIPLTGYSVSKQDITTIMNFLVNEKGELLLRPLYMTSTNNSGVVTHLYIPYAYDVDTIETKREEIKKNSDEFILSLGEWRLLTERERVLLTHDFIANKAHYAPSDINNTKYHTLYSALVEGVTVCQGYTQAMCYILPQIDVECVSCLNDNENHVWNCVYVDGKWSFVDLTWDDVRVTYSDPEYTFDTIKYDNFMINSEALLKNHKKDESYIAEFVFPSNALSWKDVKYEIAENEFFYNYMKYVKLIYTQEGDSIYFAPSGLKYKNRYLIYTVKLLEGGSLFTENYDFVLENLKASDYAVSLPVSNYKGYYEFMSIPMNNTLNILGNELKVYAALTDENDENTINELNPITRINSEEAGFGLICINNSKQINSIKNSVQAKFFFWDSNMRPYTQPTYKRIQ